MRLQKCLPLSHFCLISLSFAIIILIATNSFSSNQKIESLTPSIKMITTSKLKLSAPFLSPDNSKISFLVYGPQSEQTMEDSYLYPKKAIIWVYSLTTGSLMQVSSKIILDSEPFISWSPDSSSIAFGSKGEIDVANIDNMKSLQIQKPDANRKKTYPGYYEDYFHSPEWSPDGQLLAIRNIYDIWLYNPKSNVYKMLYSPRKESRPGRSMGYLPSLQWSHDLSKIAFDTLKFVSVSDALVKKRYIDGIAIIEVISGDYRQIVGVDENIEYFPVFSPDDKMVAFYSRKDWSHKASIYVYDLELNKSRKVADCEDECRMVSWSQDGSWLYYATKKALWAIKYTKTSPKIEKYTIKGMHDLSDVYWFPRGDNLYFLKKAKTGKYLFGTLEMYRK